MWQADHDVATEIAVSFYTSLAHAREKEVDILVDQEGNSTATISRLLHDAVLEAGDDDLEGPLGWANFIHLGPRKW